MAKKGETSQVLEAHRRIDLLREIVQRERHRAEAAPTDSKNVKCRYVDLGATKAEASKQIETIFNQLEILIDNLQIAHMAACFETEALKHLAKLVGDVRNDVANARGEENPWTTKLVKDHSSFKGLYDIEKIVPITEIQRSSFKKIRDIRNDFAHDGARFASPDLNGDEALGTLLASLAALK